MLPGPLTPEERRRIAERCHHLRQDSPHDWNDPSTGVGIAYRQWRRHLVESMLRMLRGIASTIAERSNVDAEELLSEGTIAALEAVDQWRPDGGRQIASWIRYGAFRRMVNVAARSSSPAISAELEAVDQRPGPEELAIAAEEAEQAVDLLRFLEKRQRQVLELKFGLTGPARTFRQIGREMGVSRQRVKQIYDRAITRLCSLQTAA